MFNETQEINEFKTKLTHLVDYTRTDLQGIRTGKASPTLVEGIVVETYGGTTRLKIQELATSMSEGPNGLLISPFDPSTTQDIEKAILQSPLHLTPRVEGKDIHMTVPSLTEDQRKSFIKLVSQKIEDGKNKVRIARDEIRRKIKQAFEEKTVSEDQKFRIEKDVDKIAQDFSAQLETIKEKKEAEILTI